MLKNKRIIAIMAVLFVMVGMLVGCGSKTEETTTTEPAATETASTGTDIGIVLPTRDEPRWVQDETRFKAALEGTNRSVEILFSQGSSANELQNVESLLTKGVKVLIICPQDGDAAAAAAERAKAEGVTVISYDRLITGTEAVDYYVTFDSVAVGAAQGQYLVDKATGTGNPLYLYAGAASDNNAFLFFEGAWKVLQPKIADGGKSSISKSYEQTMSNLNTISDNLVNFDSDFLFIQEIDKNSKRSYNTEQYTMLKDKLSKYSSSFAYNYTATWVPVPINQPLGHVEAGMGTFSKYQVLSSKRHQLEGQESWPMILVELDRCFIETRIPLDNGKELILINLHLSAYDKGGKLRDKQAMHLARHMNEEYSKGNYIVLGGDWNQLLSDAQMKDPAFLAKWPSWLVKAPDKLTETGFVWGIDESVMTVRDLATPYVKGETFETIIDGFLISPNLNIENVIGHDLAFKNSDHNPVTCVLKFK